MTKTDQGSQALLDNPEALRDFYETPFPGRVRSERDVIEYGDRSNLVIDLVQRLPCRDWRAL